MSEKDVRSDMLKSIQSVQADLVKYVTDEGPGMPLNRGAAILNEARDVFDARLWTRPLTQIETRETSPRYIAYY